MTRVQYPENNGNRPGSNFEHRKWNDVRFFPRGMEFEQDFVTFYRRNQGEDFRKGAFDCYQGQGSTNLPVRGRILKLCWSSQMSWTERFWFVDP